jgi:hypothetical protein
MEMLAITCPYCEREIEVPDDRSRYVCPLCQTHIDLLAHYAFLRGRELYMEALEIGVQIEEGLGPKRRRDPFRERNRHDTREIRRTQALQQAYAELRHALQSELPGNQYREALEMVTETTRLFSERSMTTGIEAGFWAKRLIELNTLDEIAVLHESLAEPATDWKAKWRQWRARRGIKSRREGLLRLREELGRIEAQIAFAEPPFHPHHPAEKHL